jgi:hypothetical protein
VVYTLAGAKEFAGDLSSGIAASNADEPVEKRKKIELKCTFTQI